MGKIIVLILSKGVFKFNARMYIEMCLSLLLAASWVVIALVIPWNEKIEQESVKNKQKALFEGYKNNLVLIILFIFCFTLGIYFYFGSYDMIDNEIIQEDSNNILKDGDIITLHWCNVDYDTAEIIDDYCETRYEGSEIQECKDRSLCGGEDMDEELRYILDLDAQQRQASLHNKW